MMNIGIIIILSVLIIPITLADSYAQEIIIVNQTVPCFLNETAGVDMWRNCGMGEDFIVTSMMGFEYVLGGYFSAVIVSIFILFTYIKYHKAIYPVLIGVIYLPIAYFLFPVVFITFAIVMTGVLFAVLIWYVFVKQTKEY